MLHMKINSNELLQNSKAIIDDSVSGSDMLFVMISQLILSPGEPWGHIITLTNDIHPSGVLK